MMNDKDVKEYHKMVDKLNKQQKELDASYKQSLANKQERMTNVKGLKKINILSLDCDWIKIQLVFILLFIIIQENSSRTPDQGPGFMI